MPNTNPQTVLLLEILLSALLCAIMLWFIRWGTKAKRVGVPMLPDPVDASNPGHYFQGDLEALIAWCSDPGGSYREEIAGCAIAHPTGELFWAYPPLRHSDLLAHIALHHATNVPTPGEQGFVTTHGRYVDRRAGVAVAERARQLIRKTPPETKLFSEDLW